METKETKKRADKPVQLTIAKLPGRRQKREEQDGDKGDEEKSGQTGAADDR